MAMSSEIEIPTTALDEFCRRHHIRKLWLFGSVLRPDFTPESDVDVLAEFDDDHVPGLIGLSGMEAELSDLFGRPVDLMTPGFFRPSQRRQILRQAVVVHDRRQ